jgi:hypothetical protein
MRVVAATGWLSYDANRQILYSTLLLTSTIVFAHTVGDCNNFANKVVTATVNGDVMAAGHTCTVGSSGFINGNLTQT